MKLYIQIFKDNNFGNFSSDIIIIPHSHIKVCELKQIIQEKYGINQSNQILTTKMCNRQFITMTNDFPLYFYFIRNGSIIYIEFIEKPKRIKDITKKINQSSIKNKYFRSIGILDHLSINEKQSKIENYDGNNLSTKRLSFINEKKFFNYSDKNVIKRANSIDINFKINPRKDYQKIIKDNLYKAVIGNKIQEFKEIMDNKYEFIDINSYLDNYKYAAIHYAAIYGYLEMMKILINRYRANVNLISADNWSPLHLSSYKGHLNLVNILLQCKEIKFNLCLLKIGTPLHCACKRNNFKIVSLLLHKCDPSIPNNEGLLPIDMTNDPAIKKIINKIMNKNNYNYSCNMNYESQLKVKYDKSNDNKINKNLKQNFLKRKMDFINFSFLSHLKKIPNQPPIYKGFIYKKGNIMSLYNLRMIEINPIKGFLLRFINEEDFPNKPIEVTLLININNIRKIEQQNYFFIELIKEDGNHIYRFQNKESRDKWFEALNNSINFKKYWYKIEERYEEASAYLNSLKQDIMEINYLNGETKKIEENKIIKVRKKKKNQYISKREDGYKINTNNILNNSYIGFNCFELLDCLGSGGFGKVFKVRMKTNGEIFAMKVINKNFLIKHNKLRYAVTECNVLKQVNSPFILTLHFSFQTQNYLYMVLDYCPGGDLNFHIMQNVFEEDDAKFYIAELILGIEHLHQLNIIYRDLKPENILISSDNHIKLADFGLAKEGINDSSMTKSFCGSPAYLTPEMIIRRGAGKSSDMYGIGAVLYEMIRGTPPFFSNNIRTLYKNIIQSKLVMPEFFSVELKDLLKQLLCKDPHKRIGVLDKSEIKNHIWFKGLDWNKILAKEIKPPLDLIKIKKIIENDENGDNSNKNIINFKDLDYASNERKKEDLKWVEKFTFIKSDE